MVFQSENTAQRSSSFIIFLCPESLAPEQYWAHSRCLIRAEIQSKACALSCLHIGAFARILALIHTDVI